MTDASATPEMLLAHAGFLAGLARSLVFGDEEADDYMQETLAYALARPPREGTRASARFSRRSPGGRCRSCCCGVRRPRGCRSSSDGYREETIEAAAGPHDAAVELTILLTP